VAVSSQRIMRARSPGGLVFGDFLGPFPRFSVRYHPIRSFSPGLRFPDALFSLDTFHLTQIPAAIVSSSSLGPFSKVLFEHWRISYLSPAPLEQFPSHFPVQFSFSFRFCFFRCFLFSRCPFSPRDAILRSFPP